MIQNYAITYLLFVGFKYRLDKHYITLSEGLKLQQAFEAWLKDGKIKTGKCTAYALVNGQQGPEYSVVVDFSDVNTVYTAQFETAT